MAIETYSQLLDYFITLGVTRAIFKPLAENDNSKQQIYLGGSFEALNQLPFGKIRPGNETSRKNFKANIDLWWVNDNGETAPAPHAQLILYPKYPEVRLSGFLRGCAIAPSVHLRPIALEHRTGTDGRFLIFGITESSRVYVYLAASNSSIARSILEAGLDRHMVSGVFYALPLRGIIDTKALLLTRLGEISTAGWHTSRRLNKYGQILEYKAKNGGGYTLEALLGIIPNGRSEPDFMGWELKGFSRDKITLMTPEPDGGLYGQQGVGAFVRKYGHDAGNNTIYFTGIHKVNVRNEATKMIMRLDGFDVETGKITNPSGGIVLTTDSEEISALWSFSRLLEHWGRKHSKAAYIKYERQEQVGIPVYRYLNQVWLGEGTDFSIFLRVMSQGAVVYDPGSKVVNINAIQSRVKARSQFRISFNKIFRLYKTFAAYEI